VCAEVYGGPVCVSIVEELQYYGISNVIGLGYVGSLGDQISIGQNICAGKSLVESSTSCHYLSSQHVNSVPLWIQADASIESILNQKLKSHTVWTTNAIYREYNEDIGFARCVGCDVVNMDTAPLFASCQKLCMNYGYVATVTVTIHTDSQWSNDLTESVNHGNGSQDELVQFMVESIPQISRLMIDKYAEISNNVYRQVEKLFKELNICKSHNIDHIGRVVGHAIKALEYEQTVSVRTNFLIMMAVMTHDADDIKFTTTHSYSNAKNILTVAGLCAEDVDLVVEMVSYVSTSANSDNIPQRAKMYPWLLIPRHVDRLDAMGINGVIRSYQFTKTKGNPLYTADTLKPSTIDDVYKIATRERYQAYTGISASLVDHYYDKLLQLGNFQTDNPYIQSVKESAIKPLLEVIQVFIENKLTDGYFENIIVANNHS